MSAPISAGVLVADDLHPVAQARAQRRHRAVFGRRSPPRGDPPAAAAARAGTAAARRVLAVGERDPQGARGLLHACLGGHAGSQQLVGGGEEARQEFRGGLVAGGARVHAAEEQLDELARDLGAQDAFRGRMEGADVERAAVPQGDAARARGPRLVHVDEVQRRDGEHVLDRARDVDRRRGRDPLAAAGEQQLAHAQHADPAVRVEEDVRVLACAADQLARFAHDAGLRDGASSSTRCPARRAPARPQPQTSRPRSDPRADAARPGRWRNALPLHQQDGRRGPAGRDARRARRVPHRPWRRAGAHCRCHARPSVSATAWICLRGVRPAPCSAWLERARDRVDQGAVAGACRAPRAARCRSSAR